MSKKFIKKQTITVPIICSSFDPILGQKIFIDQKEEEILVEETEKPKYTTSIQSLLNQKSTKTPFHKKGKRGN